ncbi:MAG: ankyrin repeat domain-containing protein [Thiobacillaceae bacterium]|jgi:ankyrin repeat protein
MNDLELKTWLESEGFPVAASLQESLLRRIVNATTPLMHAARLGRADLIVDLLARGADLRALNADGNGALWFACFANCVACVNALIKAGAPVDNQNVNGATALIYTASAGKTEMVKLLLEAGANTMLETLDGFSALDLADNRACMKMLKQTQTA